MKTKFIKGMYEILIRWKCTVQWLSYGHYYSVLTVETFSLNPLKFNGTLCDKFGKNALLFN